MARAFAICEIKGGNPNITDASGQVLPHTAYVLVAHLPDYSWGLYLFGGTGAQLTAINALASVYGICLYSELDSVITTARRTRINTWLTARGWPTVPSGWTYRQVLIAAAQRCIRRQRGMADIDPVAWDENSNLVAES